MTNIFQVGETYSARSNCDYDTVWHFTVVSRTAKFITIQEGRGKPYRVGVTVSTWQNESYEFALPLGRYSMAPVISARAPG